MRSDVEWREVEGEVVALDLVSQKYLAVNKTGAAVWPTLALGADRAELVEGIVDRFSVTPDVARADVDAFILELAANGLLETAP